MLTFKDRIWLPKIFFIFTIIGRVWLPESCVNHVSIFTIIVWLPESCFNCVTIITVRIWLPEACVCSI